MRGRGLAVGENEARGSGSRRHKNEDRRKSAQTHGWKYKPRDVRRAQVPLSFRRHLKVRCRRFPSARAGSGIGARPVSEEREAQRMTMAKFLERRGSLLRAG